MKFTFLALFANLILMLIPIHTATAQKTNKIPAKEAALIAHLVKESNQPGFAAADDVYLAVKIGRTEYTAELKTGKVVKQKKVKSGGVMCGDYAVVKTRLLDKNNRTTSQGSAGQLFKATDGEWETIALAEGDYVCAKLGELPESVVNCLKIKCVTEENK